MAGAWQRVRRAAAATARATAEACRRSYRAGRTTVDATRRAARGAGRAARRLTHAQGAGRSGLGRLIELTAAHSAGDALVTVALAGTLFFGLPVNQARGQVALYLLVTMAPFAVVAPFVGPVLDRFRSGRRYVMAGTMFARGLLCWAMAAAIGPADAVTLFPAALAVLVLSKAYNVSRAAIMPSVLPADVSLVRANARVTLFALVAAGVAGPVAAGLAAWLGPEWVLRGTTLLFLVGGVAAVRLPRHVDAPDDPADDAEAPDEAAGPYPADGETVAFAEPGHGRPRRRRGRELWRTLRTVGPVVSEAMQANIATRVQSGFLLFFLLFLVQENGLPGPPTEVTIAVLAAAAGAGGLVSSGVASWMRGRSPELISFGTLALATVTAVVAAFLFGLWTAVAVAAVAAFAQNLGKLALDAIVQREIAEEVRSSTFGVVESVLQIGWVAGGLAGLLLSGLADGPAGLGVMAAGLVAVLAHLVVARARRARAARAARRRGRPGYGGHTAPATDGRAADGGTDPGDAGSGAGDTRPLTRPHG
ncbi:hypothetical protein GCM10010106_28920 [Thermopolyspora flexuosa]|uniref:Putative MFS family arabinose efflux permease n=1 Tax=Thermopolyspora flexuosa TaxID=103836 RepID=A0A543IPB4_9ACTN|nr:MFS transporter [Thermopolyspora flexuosa]TQM72398.1 putative MFS family arabinose efflux permease [Thermopolyspora flexuosa]GGM80491.1 hypothetical protein GCM10010106_28920 [Thermopolyspora flexuosa]